MKYPKFNLLFLGILLFCKTSVKSQDRSWELGVVGGTGIISKRGNGFDVPKNFRGLSGGLSVKYNVNKHLGILLNVLSEKTIDTWQTTIIAYPTEYRDITLKKKYNYITLPLMASLNFGHKVKFMVNAGGYMNYLRKETLSAPGIAFGMQSDKIVEYPYLDQKRFDGGLILGLGLSAPLGKRLNFSFEFRNSFSLQNQKNNSTYFSDLYFNYHALFIGLMYKLSKEK